MKTKLFTLLLAITAGAGTIFASSTQVDGIWYEFHDWDNPASAWVTFKDSHWSNYNEYSGSVVIPEMVTYDNKTYRVTKIGASAFRGCTGLTSVTIPNSVQEIYGGAFWDCTGLTSVEIPNSVTSISGSVFIGCTGLTSIEIPNSVTSIETTTFFNCSSLTSVTIGNSVTSIGSQAFSGCTSLTTIEIPNSVTSITERAFEHCYSLTSVTIGNSVTSIGYQAFYGCDNLISVHISDLTAWCAISFYDRFSNPLIHAHNLYLNGELITDLLIPNTVTDIKSYAFAGCRVLTSVKIPNGVTSIGEGAFYDIPNVVYSGTATGAPWGARAVNGFVDGYVVYSDNTKVNLLACFVNAVGEIIIPNSVTGIGQYAFYGCKSLTSVTIPNSVTSIGDRAFQSCSGLTSVTCEVVTPPTLGNGVFNGVVKSIPLYVPAGSVDAYQAADQWKAFKNIFEIPDTEDIEDIIIDTNSSPTKILRDGQILIQRGEKIYTLQGAEVK